MGSSSYKVIILNWNAADETIGCVDHLHESGVAFSSILVVDNGSTDQSESMLRQAFPGIQLLQTGSNLGYAAGNNLGLQQIGVEAAYALVLNNDCRIDAPSIEKLVEIAQSDNQIAMVTPKVYSHERVILHAGGLVDWRKRFVTAGRGEGEFDTGQYGVTQEVDAAPGDCVLIRMAALDRAGYIPEEYFLYYEDSAWSLEVHKAGYKIMYCPMAVAYHQGSHSSGGVNSPTGAYYVLRNKFYFVSKYGSLSARLKQPVHWVLSLGKNSLDFTLGQNRSVARVRVLALLDVLQRRMGYRRL